MNVKDNTNIVQANYLIENRPSFTKDETRLFLTIIGAINKDDQEFAPLQVPVKDFAELWNIDSRNAYESIKSALRGLRSKEFYIEGTNPETGKRRFITSSSISTAAYEEGQGYATVEISKLFKPYLLAIKNNYTKYVLKNIMALSTVSAIRNYELLKQYENLGKRVFTVEEYKQKLHIEKKYPDNTDLKRYVIEPAVSEINEKTDIVIAYEFSGRGKKAKINFDIRTKKQIEPLSEPEQEIDDIPEGQTSMDDFFEVEPLLTEEEEDDFTTNPNELKFSNERDRVNYIDRYLMAICENQMQKMMFQTVPKEVHEYELAKINALLKIVTPFIILDFNDFYEVDENDRLGSLQRAHQAMDEERERILEQTIEEFNVQVYEVKKKGIETTPYAYYRGALKKWTLNNL